MLHIDISSLAGRFMADNLMIADDNRQYLKSEPTADEAMEVGQVYHIDIWEFPDGTTLTWDRRQGTVIAKDYDGPNYDSDRAYPYADNE